MDKDLALRILIIGNAVFIVMFVITEILERSGLFDRILIWIARNTAGIMERIGMNRAAAKIRKELENELLKGG